MNDWRSRVNMSGRDGCKAAAVILGLMIVVIFAGWVVMRLMRKDPPPVPASPVLPQPAGVNR